MEMVGGGAAARYHRHNNNSAEAGTGKNMCTSFSPTLGTGGWTDGRWYDDMGH